MKKVKLLIYSFLIIIFTVEIFPQFQDLKSQVEYFEKRYKVNCVDEKITDNFGNGFDSLYGTRNMRTILFGIAYRGGANNFYHKSNKRDNQNPLPEDGLMNLCKEGFSDAVYLYGKNFETAPKHISCCENTLKYWQISGNSSEEARKIIEMVYEVITRKRKGPIYFHCWNGWHQSGYIGAILLKQFCSFNNDQALNYWVRNTDGAHKGHEQVKNRVLNFKPFNEFTIPKDLQDEICPCSNQK
jgi:hypothetical protein